MHEWEQKNKNKMMLRKKQLADKEKAENTGKPIMYTRPVVVPASLTSKGNDQVNKRSGRGGGLGVPQNKASSSSKSRTMATTANTQHLSITYASTPNVTGAPPFTQDAFSTKSFASNVSAE